MTDAQAQDHAHTAAHAFAEVAASHPSRAAVRHADTRLTYAELAARAGGLASELRARGIGRGDVVATLLQRSPACAIAALAAWAVGAAYVHIEPTDPDARIGSLLDAVAPKAVLTDSADVSRVAPGPYFVCSISDGLSQAPYHVSDPVSDDDLAYLVFTSGSTGRPKVVEITHNQLV